MAQAPPASRGGSAAHTALADCHYPTVAAHPDTALLGAPATDLSPDLTHITVTPHSHVELTLTRVLLPAAGPLPVTVRSAATAQAAP